MTKYSEGSEGKHSTEFYAAREHASKAKWHYDRAGKQRGASLSQGIKNDYEAELLRRGVKDASGNQKPLERKTDPYRQQSMHHTRLLNVGDAHETIKQEGPMSIHTGNFAFR